MAEQQANRKKSRARKRRGAERAILETARALIAESGAETLDLATVAARAGIDVEAVNARFHDKDELLLTLAAQELSELASAMHAGDPEKRPAAAGLLQIAGRIVAPSAPTSTPAPTLAADAQKAPATVAPAGPSAQPPAATASFDSATLAARMQKPKANPVPAKPDTPAKADAAPPVEMAGLKKTGVMTPELDDLLKTLTKDAGAGTAATIARLERRINLLEHALAERNETRPAAHDKAKASVLVDESLANMGQHIAVLEKRLNDTAAQWRAQHENLSARIRFIEAGSMPAPEPVRPETAEPLLLDSPAAPEEDAAENPAGESDSFLAAARRAAIDAANAGDEANGEQSGTLARMLDRTGLSGVARNVTRRRGLLVAGVAPLPLLAAGLWVLDHGPNQAAAAPMPPGQVFASAHAPDTTPRAKLFALAQAGAPRAELVVGLDYLNGTGVTADPRVAARWIGRAAARGDAMAQFTLAGLYRKGRGVAADPATAVHWYELAAHGGNRMAMNNLAVAYAAGWGTKADHKAAAHWLTEAAERGFPVAQFNLAVLYERGEGVPHDPAKAYRWYAIAAATGDTDARARLDTLAHELDPDALLAAQESAENFVPVDMDRAANAVPDMADVIGG